MSSLRLEEYAKKALLGVAVAMILAAIATPGLAVASSSDLDKCKLAIAKADSKYVGKYTKASRRCMDDGGSASACMGSTGGDARFVAAVGKAQSRANKLVLKKCSAWGAAEKVRYDLGYGSSCPGIAQPGNCDFELSGLDMQGEDNDLLECLGCLHSHMAECLTAAAYNIAVPGGRCF
ncbi:MAG TPA: hypothetical protein EYG16_06125 [Deltaproteobacteria bacterium]|nr:hypothetical protein [Candidatus Binatota bacterium]HIL13230.1 hypothetical protein [Deltaproteobacteria bacterium]